MPITILHVINGLGRGGAESMLLKFLQYNDKMNKRKIKNIILSLSSQNTENSERFLKTGAKIYYINYINFFYKIFKIKSLFKITTIQGWMYHGNLASFFIKLFFPKSKLFFNIRHSLATFKFENIKNIISIKFNKFLSFYVTKSIYNSTLSYKTHKMLGFSHNGIIVRNGFFAKKIQYQNSLSKLIEHNPNTLIIGKIARFHKIKGYDILLSACAQLHINFILVCIGKGTGGLNFYKMLKHYKLENNTITIDEVYYPEKYLKNFDLLINSSYEESMPNIVGEACMSRTFCIASDTGDTSMYIKDKRFLFKAGNSGSLLKSINQYLKLDRKEKNNIIENNRSGILHNFSIKKCYFEYINLYKIKIN